MIRYAFEDGSAILLYVLLTLRAWYLSELTPSLPPSRPITHSVLNLLSTSSLYYNIVRLIFVRKKKRNDYNTFHIIFTQTRKKAKWKWYVHIILVNILYKYVGQKRGDEFVIGQMCCDNILHRERFGAQEYMIVYTIRTEATWIDYALKKYLEQNGCVSILHLRIRITCKELICWKNNNCYSSRVAHGVRVRWYRTPRDYTHVAVSR